MTSGKQVRTELLNALSQLSSLRPQWRLGQTLANIAMTAGRTEPSAIWDLEDREALSAAQALIEQCSDSDQLAAESIAASRETDR